MKKRVILQFIFTLTFAGLISTGVYLLLCMELRKTARDNIGKLNFILADTTRYNTVFFGASSTHTGINPVLFDSITGMYSYNAGMDGAGITELNLIISKYIKSHGAPKNIFFIFDESTFLTGVGIWYFPQYYPYINDPDFKEFINQEPKLLLGRYFPPSAITFMDDPLKNLGLIGLLKASNKAHQLNSIQGYFPIASDQVMKGNSESKIPDYFSSSPEGLKLLQETLDYCRKNNINIWLTNAPRYNTLISASSDKFFRELDSICIKNKAKTFIVNSDKKLESNYLFADERHLNSKGADIYTAILASQFINRKLP